MIVDGLRESVAACGWVVTIVRFCSGPTLELSECVYPWTGVGFFLCGRHHGAPETSWEPDLGDPVSSYVGRTGRSWWGARG